MEGIPPSIHDMGDLVSERERTIVGIGDLKKIIGVCFSIALALVAYLCQHYNGQLIQLSTKLSDRVETDHVQDKKIQQLEDNLGEARRTNDRIETALNDQRRVTTELLQQMASLNGKVSTTEEVARTTRERVEALLDYFRKDKGNAVISSEDSVHTPRGITR